MLEDRAQADVAWGGLRSPSMWAGWGGFLEEETLSAGPGRGPSPPTICLEIWEKPLLSLAGASRQACGRPGTWGIRGFAASGGGARGRGAGGPGEEEPPPSGRRDAAQAPEGVAGRVSCSCPLIEVQTRAWGLGLARTTAPSAHLPRWGCLGSGGCTDQEAVPGLGEPPLPFSAGAECRVPGPRGGGALARVSGVRLLPNAYSLVMGPRDCALICQKGSQREEDSSPWAHSFPL